MFRKSFVKKDGATILVVTAVGLALIFGLAANGLKLRDKPPSWKVTGERYGVGWQFRFGKNVQEESFFCTGTCEIASVGAVQRNSLGPLYYERHVSGSYPTGGVSKLSAPNSENPERDNLFAELN